MTYQNGAICIGVCQCVGLSTAFGAHVSLSNRVWWERIGKDIKEDILRYPITGGRGWPCRVRLSIRQYLLKGCLENEVVRIRMWVGVFSLREQFIYYKFCYDKVRLKGVGFVKRN